MARRSRLTDDQRRAAREMLTGLSRGDAVRLVDVARAARVSTPTAKRAKAWLASRGAVLRYDASARGWRLVNRDFEIPLTDPKPDDLEAALVAAALIDSLGEHALAKRVWALFDELRRVIGDRAHQPIERNTLAVTTTTATVAQQRIVSRLLHAARRRVVRLAYRSPWNDESVEHIFEPWQLRLHDAAFYVRGYSRTRQGVRTFGLAHVERVSEVANATPRAPVPNDLEVWGDEDPRFGIDHDRPGVATVRFSGGFARWVHTMRWHPKQVDKWIRAGELLERRMPYRSCRELARKLLTVGDALVSIEPGELRTQVGNHSTHLASRFGHAKSGRTKR